MFEHVVGGSPLKDLRDALPSRNRVTMSRAYNVVCEIHRRGITAFTDLETRQIAHGARYGTTKHYVEAVFLYYKIWAGKHTASEVDVIKHDLAQLSDDVIEAVRLAAEATKGHYDSSKYDRATYT